MTHHKHDISSGLSHHHTVMLDALPEGFDSGPVSYFQTDFLGESGHPFLISLHAVFMLTAWLGLLPLALALRNSRTSLSQLPRTFFMLANAIGILSAVFYQSHMPDLYAHSKHSLVAWISLAVALPILFPEPLMIASRFLKQSTWQSDGVNWDIEGFRWKPAEDSCTTPLLSRQATASLPISPTSQDPDPAEGSQISSGNTTALIILRNAFSLALVPLGWANALIGFAVYSGSCRTDHARGCFTHFTNGSFFILWGLFTFARYLGIGSHLSWCWNKPSSKSAITATSVESFALITYGLVNLLMEMVGTPTDKPFTHHQIQHSAVALLYISLGGLGVALDRWIVQCTESGCHTNTIPPLAAFLTGVTLTQHAQRFRFNMLLHVTWGYCLMAFGALRMMTIFIVYLRPPQTTQPSRPPSEILASFFAIAGGLLFIASVEDVTEGALLYNLDDLFSWANFAFALVALIMAWVLLLYRIANQEWGTPAADTRGSRVH